MLVYKIGKKPCFVSVSLKMEKRQEVTNSKDDAEQDLKFKVPPNDLLLELQLLLQELSYRADHPDWENDPARRGQTFTVDKETAAEKVKKWEKKLQDHHRVSQNEIIYRQKLDNLHLPPGPEKALLEHDKSRPEACQKRICGHKYFEDIYGDGYDECGRKMICVTCGTWLDPKNQDFKNLQV